jgi:hypothetical protein
MRAGNIENWNYGRDRPAGLPARRPADEEAGADYMTEFGP